MTFIIVPRALTMRNYLSFGYQLWCMHLVSQRENWWFASNPGKVALQKQQSYSKNIWGRLNQKLVPFKGHTFPSLSFSYDKESSSPTLPLPSFGTSLFVADNHADNRPSVIKASLTPFPGG